ncbi:hypothetical protein Bca4012_099389 [Brassica carinata]|uniref:Uncharacterized protein n=1 Tax=Brassica oleracea var. oleracea TaxID=109376 RepID=A0A0D3CTB2_BRAOL|nr:PREDICTED: UPF0725 protein EMB2204-like isoform X1 [Brassica oleracea var. oleracea]
MEIGGETIVPWLTTEKGTSNYSQILRESKGFDSCSLLLPCIFTVQENICNNQYFPCRSFVRLYAKMGLHGYNLFQGKNLQFSGVNRYNNSLRPAASSYYITLDAKDPTIGLVQTFQTTVSEVSFGELILSCKVARPYGETNTIHIGEENKRNNQMHISLLGRMMPKLPQHNPFQKTNRSYVLNKSELQDHDCISLYLELAIATTHRHSSRDPDLSNLEILEVAIESTQDLEPSEALGSASDAIFYIRYKDLSRVKSDVDCIAIVRRICHEQTGTFRLVGQIKTIPQKNKSSRTSILFRRRLGLYNPWRLSSPRLAQGKRNRGVVLARLRHFHKSVRQVK